MIPRNVQITLALVLLAVIASSIYGVQLKRRDERNRQHAMAMMPVSGENEATKFPVVMAFDEDGVLSERELTSSLPQERAARAREVLRALLHEYMQSPSPHAVPPGSDVRGVYLTNDGLCVLDVNAALADGHRSGMLLEQFTVISMMETLTRNLEGVRQVRWLVDGKQRDSLAGHADLTSTYAVDAIHAAAQEYAQR